MTALLETFFEVVLKFQKEETAKNVCNNINKNTIWRAEVREVAK